MTEGLEVNRWRRYGMDRLYVARQDGSKVGWWDLQTAEAHPEDECDIEMVTAIAHDWMSANGVSLAASVDPGDDASTAPVAEPVIAAAPVAEPVIAAPPVVEPAPLVLPVPGPAPVKAASVVEPAPIAADPVVHVSESAERPWLDLTHNAPGAEARSQAHAARDAAPVRTVLARALRVHNDERAWRLGADGEEKVAAQFNKVVKKDPRWQFIHAIPVGTRGSDIDHLLIGPGGVFTANAKNHPNAKIWVGGETLLVNGQRQPYVRNARHEAVRAGRLLSEVCGFPVLVEGLIVIVNAIEWDIKTQPRDVHVVPRRQVARWLLQHGDVLDADRQAAIFDAARRSTTWRP